MDLVHQLVQWKPWPAKQSDEEQEQLFSHCWLTADGQDDDDSDDDKAEATFNIFVCDGLNACRISSLQWAT